MGEVGCKCLDGVRGNSGERVVYGGVLVVARSSEVEVHLVGGFLTGWSGGEGGDGWVGGWLSWGGVIDLRWCGGCVVRLCGGAGSCCR